MSLGFGFWVCVVGGLGLFWVLGFSGWWEFVWVWWLGLSFGLSSCGLMGFGVCLGGYLGVSGARWGWYNTGGVGWVWGLSDTGGWVFGWIYRLVLVWGLGLD